MLSPSFGVQAYTRALREGGERGPFSFELKRPEAVAWSGIMPVVCCDCGRSMGSKACIPANHGQPSHSICPTCSERQLAQFNAGGPRA